MKPHKVDLDDVKTLQHATTERLSTTSLPVTFPKSLSQSLVPEFLSLSVRPLQDPRVYSSLLSSFPSLARLTLSFVYTYFPSRFNFVDIALIQFTPNIYRYFLPPPDNASTLLRISSGSVCI